MKSEIIKIKDGPADEDNAKAKIEKLKSLGWGGGR